MVPDVPQSIAIACLMPGGQSPDGADDRGVVAIFHVAVYTTRKGVSRHALSCQIQITSKSGHLECNTPQREHTCHHITMFSSVSPKPKPAALVPFRAAGRRCVVECTEGLKLLPPLVRFGFRDSALRRSSASFSRRRSARASRRASSLAVVRRCDAAAL